MDALAVAGCLMFYVSGSSGDGSMRLMAGALMVPEVVRYSANIGKGVYSGCGRICRGRKIRKIGRNLEGKFFTGYSSSSQ